MRTTATDEWQTHVFHPDSSASSSNPRPAGRWKWWVGAFASALAVVSVAGWAWTRIDGQPNRVEIAEGASTEVGTAPVLPVAGEGGEAVDEAVGAALAGEEDVPVETGDGTLGEHSVVEATPAEANRTTPQDASLIIDCRPWCDRVQVDGDEWGSSPQLDRKVAVGDHAVWLRAAAGGTTSMNVTVDVGGTKVCWDFEREQPCEGL